LGQPDGATERHAPGTTAARLRRCLLAPWGPAAPKSVAPPGRLDNSHTDAIPCRVFWVPAILGALVSHGVASVALFTCRSCWQHSESGIRHLRLPSDARDSLPAE